MSAILHETGPWALSEDRLEIMPNVGVVLVPRFDPTDPLQIIAAVSLTHLVGGLN